MCYKRGLVQLEAVATASSQSIVTAIKSPRRLAIPEEEEVMLFSTANFVPTLRRTARLSDSQNVSKLKELSTSL